MSPGTFITLAGLGLVIVYLTDLIMMVHGFKPLDLRRFVVAQHQVGSGMFFIFGGFAMNAGYWLSYGVFTWTGQ